MPATINFTARNTSAMVNRYSNLGWSLDRLAVAYEVSTGTIRRVLLENNVTIAPRGRRASA